VTAPIKAGEWDFAKASELQQDAIEYSIAPFMNVVNKVAEAEEIDSPFLSP